MTYENFLPYVEKWYTPKYTLEQPSPPPMCVVSPQHPLEVLLRYNFGTYGFKVPKNCCSPLYQTKTCLLLLQVLTIH